MTVYIVSALSEQHDCLQSSLPPVAMVHTVDLAEKHNRLNSGLHICASIHTELEAVAASPVASEQLC